MALMSQEADAEKHTDNDKTSVQWQKCKNKGTAL